MIPKSLDNLFFKTAVHQCNDFVIITNANAEIVYVNPAFEKHTGYKLKNIKGKNISIVKSGMHNKTFYKKLWKDLTKGNPISKIFINKNRKGEIYYENKTITPIKNKQGVIEYYLSTSKDFSKERENENKLKELNIHLDKKVKQRTKQIAELNQGLVLKNKLLRKINSNLPAIVYLLNIKTKKITLVNNTIKDNLALPFLIDSEINFKEFISFFNGPNNKKISLSSFCNNELNNEFKLKLNDIKYNIHHKSVIFEKQTNGRPLIYLGSIIDITPLKVIQNRLEETQQIAQIGTWDWDIETGQIYWSAEIFRIFELDPKLFQPSYAKFLEIIHKGDRQMVTEAVNASIENKTLYEVVHRLETKPGKIKFVIEKGYCQYNNSGKAVRMIGTIRDITETEYVKKRLEESQEHTKIGTWEYNLITKTFDQSKQLYNIWDLNPLGKKITREYILSKIDKGDLDKVINAEQEAIALGKSYSVEYKITTALNREKHVRRIGYVEYNSSGIPVKLYGSVQDITESIKIQHRLEESQKLAKIGTWEVNLKTNEVFWSKEMYNVYDVSPEKFKLTFDNLLKQVHSKDKQLVVEMTKLAIQSKQKYEIEYRIIDSKGLTKWVKGRGYAEFNSEGKPIRLFGAVQDITEEKKLQDKLKSAYITLENSLSAIFTFDFTGKIAYANKAAVQMWGYLSLKELLNEKPYAYNYWHPDDAAKIDLCLKEVKSTGFYSTSQPYKALKQNGEITFIAFSLSLIKDLNNEPVAMTGSFFDVTEELKNKKEIEENDRKLNLLLGNIDEVVYGIEVNDDNLIPGKAFFLSGKSIDIIGYTLLDLQRQPTLWYDSIHPDDYEIIVNSTIKAITQNISVTREYRMFHRLKKEYFWYEDKITTYTDDKGQIIAYYGSIRDISERKKLDLLLIESEKKYRFISENNHDLITLRDATSKPLFISNSVKKILGYEVDEFANLNLFDLVHPDDVNAIKHKVYLDNQSNNDVVMTEGRILHKNGHYIWLQTVTQQIYDEDGKLNKIVGSGRDITEKKKLEQELIEQEEKYRTIYENVMVGIFRTNFITQKPIEVNNTCVRLFGYDSREEFLEKFVSSERYANLDDRNKIIDKIKGSDQLNIENLEILYKKKDGTTFWGNTSVKVLPEEGVLEGVVIDVTLRKQYEAQLEKNLNEKDILLKEIHHRVKNNLQVISSLLKLQLQKHDNPLLRESIMESRERVNAIALIHEKMYLSEDISTINFSEYLGNLTKSIYPLYQDRNIELKLELDDFVTDISIAMPLGLACYEIISNSFKHAFNERKHGELYIKVINNENGTIITIADNGMGFLVDEVNPSKSLGWSLIKNLTKQAKGVLNITSAFNQGSEFIIVL